MNSSKLQPIVQEQLLQNTDSSLVTSPEQITYIPGTLLMSSGFPSFVMTEKQSYQQVDINVGTRKKKCYKQVNRYVFKGRCTTHDDQLLYCPECYSELNRNGTTVNTLAHLPIGEDFSSIVVTKQRFTCSNPSCNYSWDERIDFKAQNHFITNALETYICDLLKLGLTLKAIHLRTGVSEKVIKEIDKARLQVEYTVDGEGKKLKAPEEYSTYLGIDEFLLHKGHKYATLIMDIETGHVLYVAHGKKKQVVKDFAEFVGEEWLSHVKAVACDMNSDFSEEFDRLGINVVFDFFHIVKNFNDKVISEVRKDEQKRLIEEGDYEGAASLKHSKFIITSNYDTRVRKEKEAEQEKTIRRGSVLFNQREVKAKSGIQERYAKLLELNELFLKLEIIKETLRLAYHCVDREVMAIHINNIVDLCNSTDNKHFKWFARLIMNHIDGILSHAEYNITSGKVEGMNNMIKTMRRASYGIPDDEYFFLKIMDASRKDIHWK